MNLEAIFRKHGCDKAAHHYHRFYETLPPPARMLEVGVYKGASLRAWREWWPNTWITAMDIFSRYPFKKLRAEIPDVHVMFWKDDSSCPKDWHWQTMYGPFNLIIDDGSHRPRDQAATLTNLWPLLAPGGVYVIEDVVPVDVIGEDQLPEWFRKKPQQGHFTLAAFLELACAVSATGAPWERHDFRHLSGKPDSVLIVLRKP